MKTLAMLAVVGAAAISASSAADASRSVECGSLRKTVSPTHSRLWTNNYHGVWRASSAFVNADGSLRMKGAWFAAGPEGHAKRGPRGILRVSGKRLDMPVAALQVESQEVGVIGWGGSGVWAVVLTFPTEGCWTVTGKVERTTHTFQVLVSKGE